MHGRIGPILDLMENTLHGSWSIAATKSLRYTCSSPAFGQGFNLQTVPRWARYYVISPPGRVFVNFDLDQAELRVVAHEAKCKYLQSALVNGLKVHRDICSRHYGIPYLDVDKESVQYKNCKGGVHGTNYRETPRKIAITLRCQEREAKNLQQFYLKMAPELPNWQEDIKETVTRDWKLTNLAGLTRTFYAALARYILVGEFSKDEWNDACAWIPQSTIPYVTNQIILMALQRYHGAILHHHGHDSALFSVSNTMLIGFIGALEEVISNYRLPGHPTLAFLGEITYGWTWGLMLSSTNIVDCKDYRELFKQVVTREKIVSFIKGDL